MLFFGWRPIITGKLLNLQKLTEYDIIKMYSKECTLFVQAKIFLIKILRRKQL